MKKALLITAALAFTASAAMAGPSCDAPKEKWIPEAKFQQDLKDQGYDIKKFKVTKGNCYEIYGHNKDGKKVEIYFNPASAKVMKQEIED